MKIFTLLLAIILILTENTLYAQQLSSSKINKDITTRYWQASWINPSGESLYDYGVYHFRKTFELAGKPKEFIVHVSADNRYILFVNGEQVCLGPARGDIDHWRFESIDIAKWLKPGRNVLAAMVWNFSDLRPWAQISLQTGFILQGNSSGEQLANTDKSWKVIRNAAYSPHEVDNSKLQTFIVVGPGDAVDGSKYPWNWQAVDFDDSSWHQAGEFYNGMPKGFGSDMFWSLVPRNIPLMEENDLLLKKVRRSDGVKVDETFLTGNKPLVIPAKTKASVLLDQTFLTTAYPELKVSGGKDSKVELTYAEALFDSKGVKGNRDSIENKTIKGIVDVFYPDGGSQRLFRPLWFRTYRYLLVNVETGSSPLTIESLSGRQTGYPLEEKASFSSSDKSLTDIWNVGWRTARLCAGETYFDCPYYEQLQYIGDTRIQALISLYVSGDDRLVRNAITLFNNSRIAEGLTKSRYPTSNSQIISTFSLFWVRMVHDYWMHRDDPEYVKGFLMGIDNVLLWYEQKIDKNSGMIGPLPYWTFVDWPNNWPWDNVVRSGGVPPGGNSGNSSIVTLQAVYAMQAAVELFRYFGDNCKADHYDIIAKQMMESTIKSCWDANRKYMADTPDKKEFSQHANAFAILTGAIDPGEQIDLIQRVLADKSITQCTFYFRFYLYRAMKKAGLGDMYTQMLDPWRDMLKLGLTTFAERQEPTRSDCHAWSSSPNYELLATVCGIEPAESGFRSVRIEPHPGNLSWIEGKMPHPKGDISVSLKQDRSGNLLGKVTLPAGLTGNYVYNGKTILLKEGENLIH
jgi:alpha-L-rhamnosidase